MTDFDTLTSELPPRVTGFTIPSRMRPLGMRVLVVAAIGAVALGASAFALASAGPGDGQGPRLGRIQHFVAMALDSVGATSAQEAKIHDIIAANLADAGPDPKLREQALALLRAPTVDAAAAEKLRTDIVAHFDARSKAMTTTILAVAAELTPEQRGKLVGRFEMMGATARWAARGMGGGRWSAMGPTLRRRIDGRPGGAVTTSQHVDGFARAPSTTLRSVPRGSSATACT